MMGSGGDGHREGNGLNGVGGSGGADGGGTGGSENGRGSGAEYGVIGGGSFGEKRNGAGQGDGEAADIAGRSEAAIAASGAGRGSAAAAEVGADRSEAAIAASGAGRGSAATVDVGAGRSEAAIAASRAGRGSAAVVDIGADRSEAAIVDSGAGRGSAAAADAGADRSEVAIAAASPSASPGGRFRAALQQEKPLQIAGAINAYAAMLAQAAGFRALYLSGAGVANASFGLPDLGITTLNDVTEEVRRMTGATDLPLLVDADTGFGSAFNIARTVREMIRAGAAGIHIEDQAAAKRCGHRPNKAIVPPGEMADRIASAADAKHDADFVLMARTDALASEGMEGAVARALAYVDAGADMIFLEAATDLEAYRTFASLVKVPVLANITEFGRTPLFTAAELGGAGVAMALYPLSAFRAMNAAALLVYRTIREKGTQKDVVGQMQTREELYGFLDYYAYERKLDALFAQGRNPEEG